MMRKATPAAMAAIGTTPTTARRVVRKICAPSSPPSRPRRARARRTALSVAAIDVPSARPPCASRLTSTILVARLTPMTTSEMRSGVITTCSA